MRVYIRKQKVMLKELADRIRNGKSGRKPRCRNDSNIKDLDSLDSNRYKFRHHHIAYCLIRGRSLDEIEISRDDNPHNEDYVSQILKEYEAHNEALCSS